MKTLNKQDIISSQKSTVYVQDYSAQQVIEGVKVVDVKRFNGPDGSLEELMRLDGNGEMVMFPGFKLQQVNRSRLMPGSIKAWHLHYNQEDIWYADPEDHLILGLWDVREGSKTADKKMKIILGGGYSKLVYIPRGVAHGVTNKSTQTGTVFYFINQQFNLADPDERRLPWDAAGAEFWEVEKG